MPAFYSEEVEGKASVVILPSSCRETEDEDISQYTGRLNPFCATTATLQGIVTAARVLLITNGGYCCWCFRSD